MAREIRLRRALAGVLPIALVVLLCPSELGAAGADSAADAGEDCPTPCATDDSGPSAGAPPDPGRPASTTAWRPFLRPPGLAFRTPWVAPESLLVDWLGHGRARQIREARFQYFLATEHPARAADAGWRYPEHLEDYEDVVLSAWGKVVRDAFEDALGVEEWWDRKVRRVDRSRRGDRGPSWHLRVSPRVAEDRVGVKFRLPYTQVPLLDHLSFRVRYDWEEDRTTWILKLDDGARFVHLGYEPDTPDAGDLLSLSVRLAW